MVWPNIWIHNFLRGLGVPISHVVPIFLRNFSLIERFWSFHDSHSKGVLVHIFVWKIFQLNHFWQLLLSQLHGFSPSYEERLHFPKILQASETTTSWWKCCRWKSFRTNVPSPVTVGEYPVNPRVSESDFLNVRISRHLKRRFITCIIVQFLNLFNHHI